MFHMAVWQQVQRVLGFTITALLQIYQEISSEKNSINRLRFDRIKAMSLRSHFFGPPCIWVAWQE